MLIQIRIIPILLLVLILALFITASARIRHVPDEYSTIQTGINDCSNGDTLLVQPGRYVENLIFYGQNFVLASLLAITDNLSYIDSTIIDGNSNGSVLTFNIGESRLCVVKGFTIENGYNQNGGGIYCEHSSPTIAYNRICNNEARYSSGHGYGGGIYCEYADPLIANNIIDHNTAAGLFGGDGGGISIEDSNPVLINNTFTRNTAERWGGGMRCSHSYSTIINCIFWSNMGDSGNIEIFNQYGAPDIIYSDIYAGWDGEGNINANPEFRDPDNGNFHLMAIEYGYQYDSPCIDVGSPNINDILLDSLWGLGIPISDMGAYGGGDTSVSISESITASLPEQPELSQNYPNPFNPAATIKFSLPEPSAVKLKIYDITGREIVALVDEYKHAGVYKVSFDAANLSSGIYFYRLTADSFSESKRMIYLK
ncbi:MAG: T9SS type A sorting domain-containing protein [candidate division Zixibacteria bacterium]|nr:T9SS type A sorting domain-containing protein [candidate division Zixibacteria bacterium]